MIPGYCTDSSFAFSLLPESDNEILRGDIFREIESVIGHGSFPPMDDEMTEDSYIESPYLLVPSDDSRDSDDDITPMPKEFFKTEGDAVEKTKRSNVQPYTPDSDHCYSQPQFKAIQEEPLKLKIVKKPGKKMECKINQNVTNSAQVTTSDDEVDVVTVTEDVSRQASLRRAKTVCRGQKQIRKSTRKPARQEKLDTISTLLTASNCRTQNPTNQKRNPGRPVKRKINSVETSPSSSTTTSDIEDSDKRATHNNSERKRRQVQKEYLQRLRTVLPELEDNTRAAKVLIIKTATRHVRRLRKLDYLQKQNERLQEKYGSLCQWFFKHL